MIDARPSDTWSGSLFIALLRRHGLQPTRYSGQRRTTIMARVGKIYVDSTFWPEFEQFQAVLHEHFDTVTKRVIGQALGEAGSEVEERDGPGDAEALRL